MSFESLGRLSPNPRLSIKTEPIIKRLPFELEQLLLRTNGIVGSDGEKLLWSVDEIIINNSRFRNESTFTENYAPLDCYLFYSGSLDSKLLASPIDTVRYPETRDVYSPIAYCWKPKTDSRIQARSIASSYEYMLIPLKTHNFEIHAFEESADWSDFAQEWPLDKYINKLETDMFKLNPPGTLQQIESVEKQIGKRLPQHLREFHLAANGWEIYVYPVEELIDENRKFREGWSEYAISFDKLFFFGAEGNDDMYYFRELNEEIDDKVYEWDHECDESLLEGANLNNFFTRQILLNSSNDSPDDDDDDGSQINF